MKIKLLLVFISVFCVNSIYSQPVISLDSQERLYDYNKAHKKTKNMKLKNKFQLQDTLVVDTSVVYISKGFLRYWDMKEPDTLYWFKRFFKNGQYFTSDYYYTMPSNAECNNLNYGKRGYYAIKDSILTIELFDNPYDGYSFYYYVIREDGLLLFKTRQYKWPFYFGTKKYNYFYSTPLKRKVQFYTQPTW